MLSIFPVRTIEELLLLEENDKFFVGYKNYSSSALYLLLKDNIGLLHGYGLIKRGFKSRLGWRPWEPS